MTALGIVLDQIQAELDAGRFESAKALCQEALVANDDVAKLHAFLCYACQQTARHDDAVHHYRETIKRDPASWLAFFVGSQSLQALGRLEEARHAATEASRLVPTDPSTFRRRLELEVAVDGVPAAFLLLGKALPELRREISVSDMENIIQRGMAAALNNDVAEIRQSLNGGAPKRAEALIQAGLQRFPESGELYGLLAYCLQQQMRYDAAIVAAASATHINPNDWLALLARGQSLKATARLAEARACFAVAVAAHPTDLGFRNELLATTFATRGEQAARIILDALPEEMKTQVADPFQPAIPVETAEPDRPEPDRAEASDVLALIQAELDGGNFEGARQACLAALPAHAEVAQLHAMLCCASQLTGHHEDALHHYRETMARDPLSWLACFAASKSLQALGRLDEARQAAGEAGRLSPTNAGTLRLRIELEAAKAGVRPAFAVLTEAPAELRRTIGPAEIKAILQRAMRIALSDQLAAIRAVLNEGNVEGAESLIRASLRDAPEFGELHELLAYSLQQQERHQEAIVAAASATDVDPTSWLALLTRGLSLKACGLLAEARACFELAVAAHPADLPFRHELLETTLATRGFQAAEIIIESLPDEMAALSFGPFWRAVRLENGEPDQTEPGSSEIAARIGSAAGWAERHGIPVVDCGSVESDPFAKLRLWDEPDLPESVMVPGSRPYVVELPDVTIVSGSSLLVTRDDCVLNDVSAHPDFGHLVSWVYDKQILAQSGRTVVLDKAAIMPVEVEGGVMLAGLASNAFGHWVPEFLGRLPWLQQHPAFAELPLIVDAEMPQSHFDYLALVCDWPLLKLPKGAAFRCRRLLYSPPPAFFPVELLANHGIPIELTGMLSVSPLRWLRETVLRRLDGQTLPAIEPRSGKKRWLLGRRNLKWRRLVNEAEIVDALETVGFNVVYPEDMTLLEQIALFSKAEAIVAPNGSALLNLIFARPEVVLVVLTQSAFFNWGGFQAPMEQLGYRFSWVTGTDGPVNSKHADYNIDPDTILEALASRGTR